MSVTFAPGPPLVLPAIARAIGVVAFAGFVVAGLAIRLPDAAAASIIATLVALACALLLARAPHRWTLPLAGVATAAIAVIGHAEASNVAWFGLCVIGATCAIGPADRRAGLAYLAAAVALLVVEWAWLGPDPGWAAWITGLTISVAAAYLIRHELDLVSQLRAAQAGLADRARFEERNRIARELHDVIAHSLTVSLLHVTSARLAVEHDPDDAARSLAEAERLGRQCLDEVRGTVGLLRATDDRSGPITPPLPGAAELTALVERFRRAGATVDLAVAGDLGALPATTGLGVYRIVQESLTNAAKHAPDAPVGVAVDVGVRAVTLRIDSAGPAHHGSGLGLTSMRERAASLGGTCTAGPGGRGWLVAATLPLTAVADPQPAPR